MNYKKDCVMPKLDSVLKHSVVFLVPGAASTLTTHPLEHSLYGRSGISKTTKKLVFNKAGRPIGRVRVKNPARYGKIKIPFRKKPVEYDRGSYKQHLAARLPKGILAGGTALAINSLLKRKFKMK